MLKVNTQEHRTNKEKAANVDRIKNASFFLNEARLSADANAKAVFYINALDSLFAAEEVRPDLPLIVARRSIAFLADVIAELTDDYIALIKDAYRLRDNYQSDSHVYNDLAQKIADQLDGIVFTSLRTIERKHMAHIFNGHYRGLRKWLNYQIQQHICV